MYFRKEPPPRILKYPVPAWPPLRVRVCSIDSIPE